MHSAAGGLGIMAVQVARAMGCRVLGTAGSEPKCEYARSYGATQCFDYSNEDWPQRVLDATNGKGVDVVFDPVGLVDLSLKCIAHRGRILIVGFAGREGQMEKIAMNRVLLKQVNLIGYVSHLDDGAAIVELINFSDMVRASVGIPKKRIAYGESCGPSLTAARLSRQSSNVMRGWVVAARRCSIYLSGG